MKSTETDIKRTDVFWGEMAPCEHLVQIYRDDAVFLDALEGFVHGGIRAGDSVIVIATPQHREALENRLDSRGIDLAVAAQRDHYIALDADDTLAMFMVDGIPSDFHFQNLVNGLIERATRDGRNVRAFGEMVALLWAKGNAHATIKLEYLWHRFCQEKALCLFCAYPKTGFTHDVTLDLDSAMQQIVAAHSKIIDG